MNGRNQGVKNPAWKGGKVTLASGYVVVNSPDHPYRSKGKNPWVYEHRLVIEDEIGRYLLPSEKVHHINHDPSDNRIENLQLMGSSRDHVALHRYGSAEEPTEYRKECVRCGAQFIIKRGRINAGDWNRGQYCNKECYFLRKVPVCA